jgi:hypothetical protein
MPAITLRAAKGAPLSFQEVDDNFTNLNDEVIRLEAVKFDAGDISTEAQARAGVDNTTVMTPLRVRQAIDQQASKLSIGLIVALS